MAPPLHWVVLDRIPRRTDDEDIVLRGYMGVQLAQPPSISFVALPGPRLGPRDGKDFTSMNPAHGDRSGVADRRADPAHGDTRSGVADRSADPAHGDTRSGAADRRADPAHGDTRSGAADRRADPAHGDTRSGGADRSAHPAHGDTRSGAADRRADPAHGDIRSGVADRNPNHDDNRLAVADLLLSNPRLTDFPPGNSVVVAADRYAGLLLAFAGNVALHDLARNIARRDVKLYVLHGEHDAPTASVKEIPVLHGLSGLGNVGLLSGLGNEGYMVVDLGRIAGTDGQRVITFYSENGGWIQKEVELPAELIGRPWGGNGVLSHEGKIWWTDLSRGIIWCDPFHDSPRLVYEELPRGSVSEDVAGADAIRATRCINTSDGRIAYAEVRGGDGSGEASILVWSWTGGRDGLSQWNLDVCAIAAQIFAKEGYKKTGLPARLPDELILVHPLVRSIVYCRYADGIIVGLNLRTSTVVHLQQAACSASPLYGLIPWELPSFLASDRYPRFCGLMDLSDWQVELWHVDLGDLLVLAQYRGSRSAFRLKLWISEFDFAELRMKQLLSDKTGWCRVSVRPSLTQPLIHKNLSLDAAVLKVPVPDFLCIFRAFALVWEEVQMPSEHSVMRSGVHRGRYVHGCWSVDMMEWSSEDGSAMLLLKFSSRNIETFSAQMFPYPKFHRMKIGNYADDDGSRCTVVRLVASPYSREEVRYRVPAAIRVVPLPHLSYIRDSLV